MKLIKLRDWFDYYYPIDSIRSMKLQLNNKASGWISNPLNSLINWEWKNCTKKHLKVLKSQLNSSLAHTFLLSRVIIRSKIATKLGIIHEKHINSN